MIEELRAAQIGRLVGHFGELVWASCVTCQRSAPGQVCEAYPDGIPEAILNGKVDHKTPYPGDHGLTYLPVDAEAR